VESAEPTAPVPIHLRGYWFDGTSYLTITGLILHHSFTVTTWIRASTVSKELFTINLPNTSAAGTEQLLNIRLTTGYRTQFAIKHGVETTTTTDGQTIVEALEWHFVAFCVDWDKDARTSTMTNSVDNVETDSITDDFMFADG
jgi:hypothetical protein